MCMICRVPLILIAVAGHVAASDLERVRVSEEAKGFVLAESGRPFIPWGFNYDHEGDGKDFRYQTSADSGTTWK